MEQAIVTARPGDTAAVGETLAQAFQTDPALSWILPDPDPVSYTHLTLPTIYSV